MHRHARRAVVGLVGVGAVAGVLWSTGIAAVQTRALAAAGSDTSQGQVREITIVGNQFAFSPARIEVQKDDLVRIKFTAQDVAHSFTIDVPYRISKRAAAGQAVVFEFRADEAGHFTFYCNLTQDDRCKQMKGELIVR
jgi:heme/copper-type cytochrome/quinol oxidase subunit 2